MRAILVALLMCLPLSAIAADGPQLSEGTWVIRDVANGAQTLLVNTRTGQTFRLGYSAEPGQTPGQAQWYWVEVKMASPIAPTVQAGRPSR